MKLLSAFLSASFLTSHPSAEIVAARESWEARQDTNKPPFNIPREDRSPQHWEKVNQAFIKAAVR